MGEAVDCRAPLRVSLGLVSDFGDVYRFMAFLRRYVDVSCEAAEAAPRW